MSDLTGSAETSGLYPPPASAVARFIAELTPATCRNISVCVTLE